MRKVIICVVFLAAFIGGCKPETERPAGPITSSDEGNLPQKNSQQSLISPENTQLQVSVGLSGVFSRAVECLSDCRSVDPGSSGFPSRFQDLLFEEKFSSGYSSLVDLVPKEESRYLRSGEVGGGENVDGGLYAVVEMQGERYGIYFGVSYKPILGYQSYSTLSVLVSRSTGEMAGVLSGYKNDRSFDRLLGSEDGQAVLLAYKTHLDVSRANGASENLPASANINSEAAKRLRLLAGLVSDGIMYDVPRYEKQFIPRHDAWYAHALNGDRCIEVSPPARRVEDLREAGYQVHVREFGPTNSPSKVEVFYYDGGYRVISAYYKRHQECISELPKSQPIPDRYR